MLSKLFKKKKDDGKTCKLYLPKESELHSLEDVPDVAFAEKMLGDGFAIKPFENVIYSPVAGTASLVAETKHAVGITTANGAEVLVHFSTDSVALYGRGLEVMVRTGDTVQVGDPLIQYDWDEIKDQITDTITPVVVTNIMDYLYEVNLQAESEAVVMTVTKK
ncbi:MAG: PTS glucose transporter subunit IIA [Tissierellia bacterium]|nr:PTS glucose transporter subunit IIA [Tissierellia bacterium]